MSWLKTTKNGKYEKYYQNFKNKNQNQNINEVDISKLTNENILKNFFNISNKNDRIQLIHLFKSLIIKNSSKQNINISGENKRFFCFFFLVWRKLFEKQKNFLAHGFGEKIFF